MFQVAGTGFNIRDQCGRDRAGHQPIPRQEGTLEQQTNEMILETLLNAAKEVLSVGSTLRDTEVGGGVGLVNKMQTRGLFGGGTSWRLVAGKRGWREKRM